MPLQHPEILDLYIKSTTDKNKNFGSEFEINSYNDSLNFKSLDLFTVNMNSIQLVFYSITISRTFETVNLTPFLTSSIFHF